MRSTGLAATLASLVALGSVASAQPLPPRRVRLSVTRGAGADRCPDGERLREAVRGRLGYDPFVEPAGARADLAFERRGRWLVASLRVGELDGPDAPPRDLRTRARGCEALGASAALALSLAVEALPEAPAPSADPTPAPPPTPAPIAMPAPAVVAPPPPAPLPARPRPRPAPPERGWELGVDALLGVGLAPAPAFGARVDAERRVGRARIILGAMGFAPVELRASNGAVRVSLYLASVGACLGASVFSGCVLVAGGVMRAEGFEVGVAHDVVTPHVLAGLRLAVESPRVGPFRARLSAELLAPMTPTTHYIDQSAAWQTPPVAATVGLGVSARIP